MGSTENKSQQVGFCSASKIDHSLADCSQLQTKLMKRLGPSESRLQYLSNEYLWASSNLEVKIYAHLNMVVPTCPNTWSEFASSRSELAVV